MPVALVKAAMNFKFPPRGPDYVSEAIAAVLFTKRPMEFKDIFDLVHASLRSKDLAKGGEEMLRLRSHEKLQAFVASGIATKNEKKYTGVPKMLKVFIETAAEHNAAFAAGTHVYTQPATKVSEVVSSKIRRTKLPIQKVKAARKVAL